MRKTNEDSEPTLRTQKTKLMRPSVRAAARHRATVAAFGGGRGGGGAPSRDRPPRGGGRGDAARRDSRGGPPPPPPHPSLAAAAADGAAPLVILKGGRSKLFRGTSAHPLVFPDAVDSVLGRPAPEAGAPVLLADGDRAPFAWGFPTTRHSLYRVRIVGYGGDGAAPMDVAGLLTARVRAAASLRLSLGLPSPDTNVYRLINSEGDRLSGLIVDVLGPGCLVVTACAAWVEAHRAAVETALAAVAPGATIVWTRSAAVAAEEGWEAAGGEEAETAAPPPAAVTVSEAGLRFASPPLFQKGGFYADQRDNRAFVRHVAVRPGATVADLCCFSGGFAVAAAAAGASRVLAVDTSAPALDLASTNAATNGFSSVITTEKAESGAFAAAAAARGESFDVVILDPPKLAPTRASLPAALRKYASLNAAALSIVKPGGYLITCSCSGAVARESGTLARAVERGAATARARLTLVREAGAAPCHTLDPGYPEGKYLTVLAYRVLKDG